MSGCLSELVRLLAAFVAVALVMVALSVGDADPLSDYCVGDLSSKNTINGLVCMPSATAVAEDFAFRVFRVHGETKTGSALRLLQGFALAKFNYVKDGLVPTHFHPRPAKVIYVVKGELFATTLKKGDFFLFPQGLVHFQLNLGQRHALTNFLLNEQNPGIQFSTALFASTPAFATDILARSFGID
uniref:Cupin type-1 domain-containing protein n=1 Tax=Physcomitrium patens TaxID=3218 RepID=A0A2K1KUT1_PHYPA|nr:hypothetical protein PHYPA_004515 [Physcomitrium patens]